MLIDVFLWNEQTEIVDALFPEIEKQYPNIVRWYELRQAHEQAAQTPGVVTVRFMSHMWLGCPADCTIEEVVSLFAY